MPLVYPYSAPYSINPYPPIQIAKSYKSTPPLYPYPTNNCRHSQQHQEMVTQLLQPEEEDSMNQLFETKKNSGKLLKRRWEIASLLGKNTKKKIRKLFHTEDDLPAARVAVILQTHLSCFKQIADPFIPITSPRRKISYQIPNLYAQLKNNTILLSSPTTIQKGK